MRMTALLLSPVESPKDRDLKERGRITVREVGSEVTDEVTDGVVEEEEVAEDGEKVKEKPMKVKQENPKSSEVRGEEEADVADDRSEETDLPGITLAMGKLGNK